MRRRARGRMEGRKEERCKGKEGRRGPEDAGGDGGEGADIAQRPSAH